MSLCLSANLAQPQGRAFFVGGERFKLRFASSFLPGRARPLGHLNSLRLLRCPGSLRCSQELADKNNRSGGCFCLAFLSANYIHLKKQKTVSKPSFAFFNTIISGGDFSPFGLVWHFAEIDRRFFLFPAY